MICTTLTLCVYLFQDRSLAYSSGVLGRRFIGVVRGRLRISLGPIFLCEVDGVWILFRLFHSSKFGIPSFFMPVRFIKLFIPFKGEPGFSMSPMFMELLDDTRDLLIFAELERLNDACACRPLRLGSFS